MWDVLFLQTGKLWHCAIVLLWCEGYILWTMLWAEMACTKYDTPIRWGKCVWRAIRYSHQQNISECSYHPSHRADISQFGNSSESLYSGAYTIRWSRVGAIVILPSRLRWIGECAALIQLADHIGSPIIPSRASAMHSEDCRDKANYVFYCHLKTVRHLQNTELFMVSRE